MDRREFILTSAALPLAASAAAGQTPPHRVRGAFLKLSCNLYSFNAPLRSGAMKLEEVFDFCAGLGFAAVDPTGYYFPGYPDVPADAYVNSLKRRAFINGLAISGTGVRNDFTAADASKRRADVQHVKAWIECAARLGAPALRVFAGAPLGAGQSRGEVTKRVVDACHECAEYGGKYGIVVTIQNHADFIETSDQVLEILAGVNSEWFGLNLDIGSLRRGDPYEEIHRLVPHAVTWQIKENVYRGTQPEKTDLVKLFGIIREGGYRGYLPLETLGEGDPREKIPRFLAEVREAMGAA